MATPALAGPSAWGSYLGEAPALSFDGHAIRLTLFRRDGELRASDYRDILSGMITRVPLNDGGNHRPEPERRCWRLSESEEPFFPPRRVGVGCSPRLLSPDRRIHRS
jgi:hypothetical protein